MDEFKIDESMLDIECLQQPDLVLKYGEIFNEAKKMQELCEVKIDDVTARIDQDIRFDPEKYALSKITETVILNTIKLQPEYIKAKNELIEARYQARQAANIMTVLDHRKMQLENLIKLFGQQYFSGPKMQIDISDRRKQFEKKQEIQKKIKQKLNKKENETN